MSIVIYGIECLENGATYSGETVGREASADTAMPNAAATRAETSQGNEKLKDCPCMAAGQVRTCDLAHT